MTIKLTTYTTNTFDKVGNEIEIKITGCGETIVNEVCGFVVNTLKEKGLTTKGAATCVQTIDISQRT